MGQSRCTGERDQPEAGFVTGSNLLMDGGVIAALRTGRLTLPS